MKLSSSRREDGDGRFCALESAAKRVVLFLLSFMTLSRTLSPKMSEVSSEAIAATVLSPLSLTYFAASAVFENARVSKPWLRI